MKNTSMTLIAVCLLTAATAFAQTAPKAEKKEIIIEKKEGTKKEKMEIVIDGEKVTINGKPADQYKGDGRIIIDEDIIINGNSVIVPGQKGPVRMEWKGDSRPVLGVFTEKDEKGAKISRVNEKSGAEKAGLKEGDIITHVNSTPIAGPEELSEAIRKNKIDDEVSITYLRNGKTQKVKATLGKSNEAYVFNTDEFNFNFEDGKPYAFTIPRPSMPRAPFWNEDGIGQFFIQGNDRPRYGMQIQDDEDRRGVEVTEVEDDSNADKGGLKEGDIIEAIDGEKITDVDSFREKLTAKKDNPSVSLKILREGKSETLTIKVPRKLKSASL